ncbi:MAG TPA: hypothetical protein VJW77_10955 [Terriglobia bacterium]|nr:hypothetical protein [Terriglobia bacterium]
MPISRREFLGCAAGASAAGLAGAAGAAGFFAAPSVVRQPGCVLVDPGPACPLQESAAGYAAALSSSGISYRRTSYQALAFVPTIIVPAAITMESDAAARLKEHVENGSAVLYESGAAFLGQDEFSLHKRVIRSVFGLSLHDPVHLWDSADSLKISPYVDFHWPLVTKIRDFSRVVPVGPGDGETIAWFRDLPVAARRRIGKGTLVYLGSPLGPHFLSGDREASHWLRAFCAAS